MEKTNMDKSLFFITLAMICVWLIVDVAVGKNYLFNFLGTIFPFMKDDNSTSMTTEEVEEAAENAPESSAIGSNKKPDTEITENKGKKWYEWGNNGYGTTRTPESNSTYGK